MKRFKENDIHAMVEILKKDGTLSVPTDTVYGVCCRYDHEAAQEKLRDVKKRPATKAFPIMCADEEQIKSIAIVDQKAEKLIKKFMPGPITLILEKRPEVPEYVNNGKATIAVRMATSEAIKELIIKTGCPIFMSSANQSGEPTCTNLDEIENECPNLDGMMEGTVKFGKGSTIVDCVSKELKILREGPITIEQIRKIIER